MSDDTTAALQALIKQVETLTTSMTDQAKRLDDLHSFNARVLDEKKDMQRSLNAPKTKSVVDIVNDEEHDRKMRAANFEKDDDGKWQLRGLRPSHSLTRAEARDPRKYAEAKAAAEKAGATLNIFDEGDGDPTIRNTQGGGNIMQSKTFTFDDTHERIRYVRADMHPGSGIVHRQLAAEREGLKVRTFRSLDDLPAHARTKFELMERAANADS